MPTSFPVSVYHVSDAKEQGKHEVREQKVMPFNGRHYQTVLDNNNYI
ncbi:unnamed protein product [Tetraodon nigroviridis]|uniref:(spotted green pufferfish) hypothetical protein n=1 Tax=Tetraodon nigroviridis TaxID=99883 RepID=Q4SCA1_TETNG|nr:unnamed protein product [Tetraodon nigroviridis]